MIVSETQTWSICLQALTDMHVCAPPESSWDPAHESGMAHSPRFLVESGSAVVLRPDDVVQIGQFILKVQRDSAQPEGEVDDVQVKSSGHTGVIVDTEDEELQIIKTKTTELPSNLNQTLSTPDVQSNGTIVKLETIMETPAASRHQDAAVKTSPILSCTDENALRVNTQRQENIELISNTRVVAESFDDGTTSVGGSVVQSPRVQNNDSLPNSVIADPIEIIQDFNAETGKKSPVRLDQPKEDSQISSATRVGHSLQTHLDSQEGKSDLPPSLPMSASPINGPKTLEASDGISVQLPSESKLSNPHLVPESSSKSGKRKRLTEENEAHATKTTFQIEIPVNKPVITYKRLNKRPKLDPVTVSSSGMLDSTRRSTSGSPRGSGEPSPFARSTRSSILDTATPHPSTESRMKVMFARSSSVYGSPRLMKFLTRKGVSKVKSVKDCDVLCVGSDQLKKTSNLVLAVLHGKPIINDEWARDSCAKGQLQDIHDYLARDPEREAEWGINLSEAIQRGKENVKPLTGHVVCFTEAAKKELGSGYSELKEIAMLAGSKAIRLGSRKITTGDRQGPVIIIASQDDEDLELLHDLEKDGLVAYSKDIITLSALRGALDTQGAEFVISKSSRTH